MVVAVAPCSLFQPAACDAAVLFGLSVCPFFLFLGGSCLVPFLVALACSCGLLVLIGRRDRSVSGLLGGTFGGILAFL